MCEAALDFQSISKWDDAYNNVDFIPSGIDFPPKWQKLAQQYRDTASCQLDIPYGSGEREVLDLFSPSSPARGLMVFVHGGYWVRFNKSFWSHLSKGFNDAGWAVAMPSYSLCPDVSIADISNQVCNAIAHAATMVDGPIILMGHSAGGHLVSSAVCTNTPLAKSITERVGQVVSISGVHDLRPLLNLSLNDSLKLTRETAQSLSPAMNSPLSNVKLTTLVGALERPEFLRQNALLANIWMGLGAATNTLEIPDKHHFNVIDFLCSRTSLVESFIGNVSS